MIIEIFILFSLYLLQTNIILKVKVRVFIEKLINQEEKIKE